MRNNELNKFSVKINNTNKARGKARTANPVKPWRIPVSIFSGVIGGIILKFESRWPR
jgi:hypothetical protein